MKNFYAFLFLMALSGNYLFGSELNLQNLNNIRNATPEDLKTLPADIQLTYTKSIDAQKMRVDKPLLPMDTLTSYFERASKYTMYGITINGTTYPLIGTNPLYYFIGQYFSLNANQVNNYKLSGLLIPFGIKFQGGSYPDTAQIVVYAGNPDKPGTLIGTSAIASGRMYLANADSNSTEPVFSYTNIDATADLSKDFAVFVQTLNFNANETDFISIYASEQGDGNNESKAMLIGYSQQSGSFFFAKFADAFASLQMSDGNPPNLDVLILPVITPVTDIKDPVTINGFTLYPVSPNPVVNSAVINFENTIAGNVKLNLVDMNGYLVKNITNSYFGDGLHSVSFDVNDLPSGTYLITAQSAGSNFAIKVNVVK